MTARRRKTQMDKPETPKERGQEFIKAIVKSAMVALISIGVKTEDNINRFMIRFEEEVEKRLKDIGMMAIDEPTPSPTPAQVSQRDPSTVDIKELKLPFYVLSPLKKAGITTYLQLLEAMQKDDLTKIKGIKETSAEKIREAVKNYKG